jgi:hypothetical protein
MATNVVSLPKTREQAERLKKIIRRDRLVEVSITIKANDDAFRVQRAWRVLFGLYQDCACIQWSKGFKKTAGGAFTGKMRASRLPAFLREAMDYVAAGRARIEVDGERLRPLLLDVMAA